MSMSKLATIERHLIEEQARIPEATGEFTSLLYDIALAGKIISREVNRAGLAGILGYQGSTNIHGEAVKKLDAFSDEAIFRVMDHTGRVAVMASEEQDDIIPIPAEFSCGKYVLSFDPLDGSSNIEANGTIGTIFSIHRKISAGDRGTEEDVLQPGHRQVAAGYILYGSSTMLVYTAGQRVDGFTLEPSLGEFLLSNPSMRIPERGKTISVNEQGYHQWDPGVRSFVDWVKEDDKETARPRSARYVGSLVADFHRNLIYGGLFLYPGTQKRPEGKLRLLYELSPLAFICEAAGGVATDCHGRRLLDIEPTELHQRAPACMGSRLDVEEAEAHFEAHRQG